MTVGDEGGWTGAHGVDTALTASETSLSSMNRTSIGSMESDETPVERPVASTGSASVAVAGVQKQASPKRRCSRRVDSVWAHR